MGKEWKEIIEHFEIPQTPLVIQLVSITLTFAVIKKTMDEFNLTKDERTSKLLTITGGKHYDELNSLYLEMGCLK